MILCEQCQFWVAQKDNPDYGECRRNAPSPKIKSTDGRIYPETNAAFWPYTRSVDGCSQGKPAGSVPTESKIITIDPNDTPSKAMSGPNSAFNKAVQKAKKEKEKK